MEGESMNRKNIPVDTQRYLWIHSMGECGNPECRKNLFEENNCIGEIAHIVPYSKNQNNSFDNLIILCPNCHTNADKSHNIEILKIWKQQQQEKFVRIKQKRFSSFKELKTYVKPLLERNRCIYEHYYLNQENSTLWEKFENEILANNKKISLAFNGNLSLFQGTKNYHNSNYQLAQSFILHVQEFEKTRSGEKLRQVLFPDGINSVFDIEPLDSSLVSNVSALQNFIKILKQRKTFIKLKLFSERPFVEYHEEQEDKKLFLHDQPKVRQIYWDNQCYKNKNSELRLECVVFLLSWLSNNHFAFEIPDETDISSITLEKKYKLKLVYEYCLSGYNIRSMSPSKNLLIVNLHNFNGEGCISPDARQLAENMQVKIFTTNEFYKFCHDNLS